MRWEKVEIQTKNGEGMGPVSFGPGKRWGHTCNSIRGGKFLYLFGGYGKDNCHTNQVHIFDTSSRTWSEPIMKGKPPIPRDSHTCTTVGDSLFIFGGTDGINALNDLHILDTSSNTWVSPSVRGEEPMPREGHSAVLVGKQLFIFGGCGKSPNSSYEEYYNDLYILNTETLVWKHAETSGSPPANRESHTCSSWKNKIIVIGGEDLNNYLSDVHILDTDTLTWGKLNTSGQLLPPRGGHTTVALGKNLFVFGGFTDEQNLFDDMYLLDVETGYWTKVMATGEGPSPRFSMAGDSLDPEKGGVLVFIGGCNKNLEALDDMYYLITGLAMAPERDERRREKLSLRKQLKLKCQEQQHTLAPTYDKSLVRVETNVNAYQPMPVVNQIQPSRQHIYLHEYQTPPGKRSFQAKVTKSFADGYTVETLIDGKLLRGVLFSSNPSFRKTTSSDSVRKTGTVEIGGAKPTDDHNSESETARSLKQGVLDDRQAGGNRQKSVSPDPRMQATAASQKVPGEIKSSMAPNVNFANNETSYEMAPAATCVTSPPEQAGRASTAEEPSPLIENPPAQVV